MGWRFQLPGFLGHCLEDLCPQLSSQSPGDWAQQALALPLDTVEAEGQQHRPQPLQLADKLGRGSNGFSSQLCPRACSQGGKYVLNGEVSATNISVEKHGGENPAGCWSLGGSCKRLPPPFVSLAWEWW